MPYKASTSELAKFQQCLIGTWSNKPLPGSKSGEGGESNPVSYNIMPLPQDSAAAGYILKNFKFFETIVFHDDDDKKTIPVVAKAPNRGGSVTQNALAVFYDQQIRFGEGVDKGKVVHVENGAWLSLKRLVQREGAYPTEPEKPVPVERQQPIDISIAKQIAVPHGNSVLALGGYNTINGNPIIFGQPVISDSPSPYPVPVVDNEACAHPSPPAIDLHPYTTADADQNPNVDFTTRPNKPLQNAVDIIKPDCFIHWRVTTLPLLHGRGVVTNIPFEKRLADVTGYWADYWLLSIDDGASFSYLAYTQTMLMNMIIKGHRFTFPHVTCNVVTKHDLGGDDK